MIQNERQGDAATVLTHRFPEVRGGVCESCGILDPKQPGQIQYKLCPHFREIDNIACNYCPPSKNPDEVIRSHVLNIYRSPNNPNAIISVCDESQCMDKHIKRFQANS